MIESTARSNVLLFLAVCAAVAALIRIYPMRSARGRNFARRLYTNESNLEAHRNFIALAPLWVTMCALFAVAVVIPRWAAQWILVPALAVGFISFLVSYRVPAPFLPRWIREEIVQGITRVARPTRGDWLIFWLVFPIGVLALISAVLLIVVFREGVAPS